MSPADFLVLFRRQAGNDEVAGFAEDEKAVAISRQERRAVRRSPLAACGRLE